MANKHIDKHPNTPPQTVGDADDRLPTDRTSSEPAKPVVGEPGKPDPDKRTRRQAAPEDSNYEHPNSSRAAGK